MGTIYISAVISLLTATGIVFLIPFAIFLVSFQVNTWTMVIMRKTLLKDQTWMARKIDERYKEQKFNNPSSSSRETRYSSWPITICGIFKFFVFAMLSFIPVLPQIFMIPSIGWEYASAIYIPNELQQSIYWANISKYISFGISAALFESVPFFSGLFFTANYLGGMLMEKRRLSSE